MTTMLAVMLTGCAAPPMPPQESSTPASAPTPAPQPPAPKTASVACFTPGEPCAELILRAIDTARLEILVEAYSFTNRQIADALIAAAQRGVDVHIIIDRRHAFERGGMMPELALAGIPILVDNISGLAHSKVMILDRRLVLTGSYNFTNSAEHRNAENLLMLLDQHLAAEYVANWENRAAASR